jgi:hypothetical protein
VRTPGRAIARRLLDEKRRRRLLRLRQQRGATVAMLLVRRPVGTRRGRACPTHPTSDGG